MPRKRYLPDPLQTSEALNDPRYYARTIDALEYCKSFLPHCNDAQLKLFFKLFMTYNNYREKQRMKTVKLSFEKRCYQAAPFDPDLTRQIAELDEEFSGKLRGDAKYHYLEMKYFVRKRHEWEQEYTEIFLKRIFSK